MSKVKIHKVVLIIVSALITAIILFNFIGNKLPGDVEARAQELKEYCIKKGYNTKIGILVDYSVHSGCCRYVVWDFKTNKALVQSICAQGCGKGKSRGKGLFSNEIGSLCSSLGHYKIGNERTMNTIKGRPAFNLTGLDATNSNAEVRGILLHPAHLPSFPIFPFHIPSKVYRFMGKTLLRPSSEGCVAIPFARYRETKEILNANKDKPVILWVYTK